MFLLMGCSKKSETRQDLGPDPAAKADEHATPEDKAGELGRRTAAEAGGAPTPAAPGAPAADVQIDCATLVTAEDVATACGGKKVEVTESATKAQIPNAACASKVTEPGKQFPIARIHLQVFPQVAGAESWVKLEKVDDSKDLPGVGDMAWTTVAERKQLKTTDYTVGVRKGRALLKLSESSSLDVKVPCTIDQLAELAKIITARIP
jgi:hypothetical protein